MGDSAVASSEWSYSGIVAVSPAQRHGHQTLILNSKAAKSPTCPPRSIRRARLAIG